MPSCLHAFFPPNVIFMTAGSIYHTSFQCVFFDSRAATTSCITGDVAQRNHRNVSPPQQQSRAATTLLDIFEANFSFQSISSSLVAQHLACRYTPVFDNAVAARLDCWRGSRSGGCASLHRRLCMMPSLTRLKYMKPKFSLFRIFRLFRILKKDILITLGYLVFWEFRCC
jgi:hypothetical protein